MPLVNCSQRYFHCVAVMFIALKVCRAVVGDSDQWLRGLLISITSRDRQYHLTNYCLHFKILVNRGGVLLLPATDL